jgi:O-acetyl-ADP-ribose deacetylase (regulator of RNase III)
MGLRLVRGDIFESGADALVNPVNCKGVSGAGLAKVFAQRFPLAQVEFENTARAGRLLPGTILVTPSYRAGASWIVFLPTKRDWRKSSIALDIEESLVCLRGWLVSMRGVRSVAVPALGCGLGGLDFNRVNKLVGRVLGPLDADVMLYEPGGVVKVA